MASFMLISLRELSVQVYHTRKNCFRYRPGLDLISPLACCSTLPATTPISSPTTRHTATVTKQRRKDIIMGRTIVRINEAKLHYDDDTGWSITLHACGEQGRTAGQDPIGTVIESG
jgi:hypothetical protein